MDQRTPTALAATVVLLAGLLVALTGNGTPSSAATCTAGLKTTSLTSRPTAKVRVKVVRAPAVRRPGASRSARWRASATVAASFGTASATVVDTFCTHDVVGRALTWRYSATANGRSAVTRSATGATKAQAKSRLAKRIPAAKRSVARAAKKHGVSRARTAATRAAQARASGISHVIYLTGTDDSKSASTTPRATALRLSQSGSLTRLVIPSGYTGDHTCLTRAHRWPRSFLVDAGSKSDGVRFPGTPTLTFSNQGALNGVVAGGGEPDVEAFSWTLNGGKVSPVLSSWRWGWSAGAGGVAVGEGSFNPASQNRELVCFRATQMPAGTVAIAGLRVGAGLAEDGTQDPVVRTMLGAQRVAIG